MGSVSRRGWPAAIGAAVAELLAHAHHESVRQHAQYHLALTLLGEIAVQRSQSDARRTQSVCQWAFTFDTRNRVVGGQERERIDCRVIPAVHLK